MKRTKTPDRKKKRTLKKGKAKPGPKSSCTEEVIQEAYRLCLLGSTNEQMAEWFGKDKTTIDHWYATQPEFRQAVDQGRKHADGKVAEALYKTALGYEHRAIKFFKINHTEEFLDDEGKVVKRVKTQKIKKVPYTKKYKPDTKAAEKFLGVRNRKTWGQADKVEHKHAHMHVGGMNIHSILEEISDGAKYSDEELKAIAKLGLSEKAKQITNGAE